MDIGCNYCKQNYSSNDIYISCDGCHKLFHTKCVMLSPRTGDDLRSSTPNGLQWFCAQCRKFSTSALLRLLDECRSPSKLILDELERLQSLVKKHVATCDKLYELACCNEIVPKASNIQQKRAKPKSAPKSKTTDVVILSDVAIPSSSPSTVSRADACLTLPVDTPLVSYPLTPVPAENVTDPTALSSNVPEPDSLHHSSSQINLPLQPSSSVNLVVVKKSPRKTIFLSRLSSHTTEKNILDYISSKISMPSSIKCIKYNFKEPREIASFKLLIPDSLLGLLLSQEFWPDGALVHEFVSRPKKSTSAAAPITPHPKND